jgi:hypothetical protein
MARPQLCAGPSARARSSPRSIRIDRREWVAQPHQRRTRATLTRYIARRTCTYQFQLLPKANRCRAWPPLNTRSTHGVPRWIFAERVSRESRSSTRAARRHTRLCHGPESTGAMLVTYLARFCICDDGRQQDRSRQPARYLYGGNQVKRVTRENVCRTARDTYVADRAIRGDGGTSNRICVTGMGTPTP